MLEELARLAAGRPAIVFDDDPTGTQTLRDVPVLTTWDADAIGRQLHEPVVFLSTNSRSLEEQEAFELARRAAGAALQAALSRGVPLSLVSRSDSTLRGHFPAETRAIAQAADMPDARVLLAPFFGEGGRVTVDDVHYLEREGRRLPVADTEFARDRAFGYQSSNLCEWVAEKHAAAGLPTPPLASLELDLVRRGGAQAVTERLLSLPAAAVVIANAEIDADIETVALGALRAEEAGLPLIARVAASYVRARAGRSSSALLRPGELGAGGPGLVVVGSHVDATTHQLERLRRSAGDRLILIELSVADLLAGERRHAIAATEQALAEGRTAVVFTERLRAELEMEQGRSVSRALAGIVAGLTNRPAWVLAKGGITSADVAVHGLGIAEARVAGQLLAGVPVWWAGAGSRWPGLPLVVFPGNVGGPDALVRALEKLWPAAVPGS